MADDLIDIEALLAPLAAGEGGAGENPRDDYSPNSVYQELSDARKKGRDEERAQDASDEEPVVPAAWRDVRRLAIQSLAEKGKSFVVAAWLCEAMVRLEGLAGLTATARLIEQLADRYWENGFPLPDEEGLEDRAAALGGLAGEGADGMIMQPIRRVPLFRRGDGKLVGLHLWLAAEDTASLGDEKRKQARLDAGVPAFDALEREARADSRTLRAVALEAREANRAWAAMDAKLSERFGALAPSTRRVTEALERIVGIGQSLLGSLGDEGEPGAGAEESAAPAGSATEGGAPAGGAGPGERKAVRTR
ncbi:MAG: type VI secretion system ImpA family N-terminal domain-containing protein, partial [Acetobacteraceae bacterium]|nr:type VI secretion system ImpA family N-terminal domain-containing protein [Acetobacteraceae bacterium]